MRVLVCGGRDYDDLYSVYSELDKLSLKLGLGEEIVIIEGGATGADRLARKWARATYRGVITVKANWDLFGKAAGPIRNDNMLEYGKPDIVLAFPGANGLKKGTGDMVRKARAAGVEVKIIGQERGYSNEDAAACGQRDVILW